jgi:hypothetical protein
MVPREKYIKALINILINREAISEVSIGTERETYRITVYEDGYKIERGHSSIVVWLAEQVIDEIERCEKEPRFCWAEILFR